ncbi:MAG: hypothetical protein P8X52_07730 [Limibacillus sp.]
MRPTHLDPNYKSDGHWTTLRELAPYLWREGRGDLKVRVVVALVLLVAAKLTNVYVPIILKMAVDRLGSGADALVVAPIGLLIAYGLARVGALGFGELRDSLFARVAQNAIREVALKTFRHLASKASSSCCSSWSSTSCRPWSRSGWSRASSGTCSTSVSRPSRWSSSSPS